MISRAASTTPETQRSYYKDTYLFNGQATVLNTNDCVSHPNKSIQATCHSLVIDDTIFHPQGGGQPADVGVITDPERNVAFTVTDCRADPSTGIIYHYGSYTNDQRFELGQQVELSIDAEKRRLYARLHSAGHLIDRAIAKLGYNLQPTKGYHFPDGPFVEYGGKISAEEKASLPDQLNEICAQLVSEEIPTLVKELDVSEAQNECGPSTDLSHFPQDKPVRIVGLAGEICPCGGTHVSNTKDIQKLLYDSQALARKTPEIYDFKPTIDRVHPLELF